MRIRNGLRAVLSAVILASAGEANGQGVQTSPVVDTSLATLRAATTLAKMPALAKRFTEEVYPQFPEGIKKLWDILSNAPMPRMFGPGTSRYSWEWLAARYDADHDGVITRREFPGPAAWFDRLDRDHDGVLTKADFDWSDRSPLVQKTLMASQLFNLMDGDSNGTISADEWAAFFAKAAKGKTALSQDDLQALLYPSTSSRPAPYTLDRQLQRLQNLFRGDSGLLFGDAPRVGSQAPDFRLKTQDGKKEIRLSQFQGDRPVVLVFGSFT